MRFAFFINSGLAMLSLVMQKENSFYFTEASSIVEEVKLKRQVKAPPTEAIETD